jgi:hypothetical protein
MIITSNAQQLKRSSNGIKWPLIHFAFFYYYYFIYSLHVNGPLGGPTIVTMILYKYN